MIIEFADRKMSEEELAAASEGFCHACRVQLMQPEETVIHMNNRLYDCTVGECPVCHNRYVITWERRGP